MVGFTKFSKKQAKAFATGRPMTPGGTRLAEEPYDVKLPGVWRAPVADAAVWCQVVFCFAVSVRVCSRHVP
jgi:hypothetical protein